MTELKTSEGRLTGILLAVLTASGIDPDAGGILAALHGLSDAKAAVMGAIIIAFIFARTHHKTKAQPVPPRG